jgi:hypothetical protein
MWWNNLTFLLPVEIYIATYIKAYGDEERSGNKFKRSTPENYVTSVLGEDERNGEKIGNGCTM